jgi:hypothetical protein
MRSTPRSTETKTQGRNRPSKLKSNLRKARRYQENGIQLSRFEMSSHTLGSETRKKQWKECDFGSSIKPNDLLGLQLLPLG